MTVAGGGPPAGPVRAPAGRGHRLGVRAGQVVAVQAAIALAVAAAGSGPVALTGAVLAGAALTLVAWIRVDGRWAYEWLLVAARYATRGHATGSPPRPGDLLGLVAPGAQVIATDLDGDRIGLVADTVGLTAVLVLEDPASLLATPPRPVPDLVTLLPPAGGDAPPVRIQVLVTVSPPAGAGPDGPAASYRRLTGGRVPGAARTVLAIRVPRTAGWSDDDLRRTLSSQIRRLRRRLAPTPARPLPAEAVPRVLAELAHLDGTAPAHETWPAVSTGGLVQATFRLRRWPAPDEPATRRLVPALLGLPVAATTVSVAAGPRPTAGSDTVPAELAVRLAASSATELSAAARLLHQLLAAAGARADRLDGEQLPGFAATLPLGGFGPGRPGAPVASAVLAALAPPVGGAGLVLGADRHGAPLVVRVFRAEPTLAMLVGGVTVAQLITLRVLALGVRVVVRTDRPGTWEPFVRGVGARDGLLTLVAPGQPVTGPPAAPLRPVLVVVDSGPVDAAAVNGPWTTSLVVRDEVAAADAGTLAGADLVLLQRLPPDGAALVGSTLGLGTSADWLPRIRADMIGVVSRNRLRWALLSPTSIETGLLSSIPAGGPRPAEAGPLSRDPVEADLIGPPAGR
ncbi:type VII secretion protein EccE [Polymorphospora sp. NPDC050346]|uniref:type VII secretion protein EccE n=1 Tax=Polymorphospora sp. NPDC050346 TaxID=3155780 RepID=UPI0033F9D663